MKIRYRDTHGKLMSPANAKSRKGVVSEIYNEKTGKRIGSPVRGYYSDQKKLARQAMPPVTVKTTKQYTPRSEPRILPRTYYADEPEYEEPDEDELDELEDEWEALYEDDWGELDTMDDLEDLLADDDEWYEHA